MTLSQSTRRTLLKLMRQPLIMLWTVPTGIVLTIGLSPLLIFWIETRFSASITGGFFLQFSGESARTMLTVVATGAITTLSLTYSLVLVVFTLAAGNIGPRLLKRFTSEIVNQVTAGIFGGTFLYALIALLFTGPEFVPRITVLGAVLLAILSVLQLIYFVRHVSQSIMIDDEVAQVTAKLTDQFQSLKNRAERTRDASDDADKVMEITAEETGYVGYIDEKALSAVAKENDARIDLAVRTGSFLISGQPLAYINKEIETEIAEQLHKSIDLDISRSAYDSVEFSINLLLEIALRALSPGVNDTFTALAVTNALAGALAEITDAADATIAVCDEDGTPRLVLPGLSFKHLMGQAFHPLRRNCGNNILMAQGIARALAQLATSTNKDVHDILKTHAELLLAEMQKTDHPAHDMESVIEYLPPNLRDLGRD